jgi:hypothetical protein
MLTLPCSHNFHAGCMLTFARSDCASHGCCPNCQAGPSGSTSINTTLPLPSAPDSASKKMLDASFAEVTFLPPMVADPTTAAIDGASVTSTGFSTNGVKLGRPKGNGHGRSLTPSHVKRTAPATVELLLTRWEATRTRAAQRVLRSGSGVPPTDRVPSPSRLFASPNPSPNLSGRGLVRGSSGGRNCCPTSQIGSSRS